MNARDRAEAQALLTRRTTRALAGETEFDVPAPPPLRGVAWGVLLAVVVAVVLFATVLVADGRKSSTAGGGTTSASHPSARPSPKPSPADPSGVTPAGAWTLERPSGTSFADNGPRHLTARMTGSIGWTRGPHGGTYPMLGSAPFAIDTAKPVLDTGRDYTVAAWVRLDGAHLPTLFSTAVSQDSGPYSAFYLQYAVDNNRFSMSEVGPKGATSARAQAHAVPQLHRWYFLTGVRDQTAGTLTLYVDGVVQTTVTATTALRDGGPLRIGHGRYNNTMVDTFPGAIARVGAYQRVLTAVQVRALYRAGR